MGWKAKQPLLNWLTPADVDVDLDTCEVTVRDVIAVDDVGRVIHPLLCEGQVEGGTLQAVGYATIEELKLADGRTMGTFDVVVKDLELRLCVDASIV